jgi:annexin A7/11
VEILGRRTAEQRAEIRRAYASVYKESLLTRLDSELSSHFQVHSRLASKIADVRI